MWYGNILLSQGIMFWYPKKVLFYQVCFTPHRELSRKYNKGQAPVKGQVPVKLRLVT
jgi:hypothetical protein